jgi:hypothetical protein
MLTQTEEQRDQHRRERFNGWNLGQDDDSPKPPELAEPCPMSSGQARRAWRHECRSEVLHSL